GYSSQAINPHFPHTVRKTETRNCSDCHLSADGDNNAIMAQTLGYGTDYIDFMGYFAWVGGEGSVEAVQVTEWEEPQAVIGSFLHSYAYPDWYGEHLERDRVLPQHHAEGLSDAVQCLQHRGEYLYAATGKGGFRVLDIANIANKGVSDRILTGPFSEFGHDTQVESANATCVSIVTTQPVAPERNQGELMRVANQERPFHPIYHYAFVTDAEEGLIVVNIDTFTDGEPRNNFLERALTWNEGGILKGAQHITMGGHLAYILADAGLVVVDLDDPLEPRVRSVLPLRDGRASHLQFRYLFVTDAEGLKVVDVTDPDHPFVTLGNTIRLADAGGLFVARTWVYVAAGDEGLVIVDAEKPTALKRYDVVGREAGIVDARDVSVAHTNASLFAYVADGREGLKVVQLTAPDRVPGFYGFSPDPKPELVARYQTDAPAVAVTRPLERDRAVDETGGQIAVFGRLGAGPLYQDDMRSLVFDENGKPWTVTDTPGTGAMIPRGRLPAAMAEAEAQEIRSGSQGVGAGGGGR
ncbi:MAG: hypothetical protein VXX81_07930, partial [Pseudomonadota bacterium]|nr:hypothetical protein [Pseudomonadota bacterium]